MKKIRKLTRGDTFTLEVEIKDNGEYIAVDEMYLTVKESCCADEILFQKKIGSGITYANNKYSITIDCNDTDKLEYDRYAYDIEIVKGSIKKTLEVGILCLCEEVTFSCDEVK